MRSTAECGTYAGWKRHRRQDTDPCERCREAYNAYHRNLRRGDAAAARRKRQYNRARTRALERLRAENLGRFGRLLNEELSAAEAVA